MSQKEFNINALSPMAQGINKDEKSITFIAKSLPEETVKASVYKSKKQIHFAVIDEIIAPSPHRIESECLHYDTCSACHYLHTTYEEELKFKKQALLNYFKPFAINEDEIKVIASQDRFHYRNRVQLHYRHQYLGFINPETDQVVEVPSCRIIRPELQEKFDDLYSDKSWIKEHQGRGHVELYLKDGDILESWDGDYASGGFTQVNEAINKQLCELVNERLEVIKPEVLVDCFSGLGNLSNQYTSEFPVTRKMIDLSKENVHEDFLLMNLYDDDALQRFINRTKIKAVDCLLIDPPRKGFPHLNDWVNKLKSKHLVYVSCDPVTLVRDLKSLTRKFNIEEVCLLDMFPGTYHFETFVSLKLKK